MNSFPIDWACKFTVSGFVDDFGNEYTLTGDPLWSYIYFTYGE